MSNATKKVDLSKVKCVACGRGFDPSAKNATHDMGPTCALRNSSGKSQLAVAAGSMPLKKKP